MANRDREIKFPCPVRRINVAWRDGNWTIEKESRIESMTLPKSDEMPEEAKRRGVAGFWYEAVDAEGRTIYRQVMMDPFTTGMEVFDEDRIRRKFEMPHDVTLKIFVPDVPELAELHIYSSAEPSAEHEKRSVKGPAQRIAAIDLRGERGGGYGNE